VIRLERSAEPEVLAQKKEAWTKRFLEARAKDPKKRPESKQYAHPKIVEQLQGMSHDKCFYCEDSVKDGVCEVDHYLEVAERPELAFEWSNLYLACKQCNKKAPNKEISVNDCIDPCDLNANPDEHLTFDREFIRPRNGSTRGRTTIKKYRLARTGLEHKRVRHLQRFGEVLDEIRKAMVRDGRQEMNERELETLRALGQPEAPFSLMFAEYLKRNGF